MNSHVGQIAGPRAVGKYPNIHHQRQAASQRHARPASGMGPAAARAQRQVAAGAAQKVNICIDCGYIYDGRVPFSQLPSDYRCPECGSVKRRFKPFIGESRGNSKGAMATRFKAIKSGEGLVSEGPNPVLLGVPFALLVAGAAWYATQLQ